MAESNADRVRRAYLAFADGDLATLRTLMSPECTWVVAGDNALTGSYRGLEACFDYFAKLVVVTDGTLRIDLQDVTEVQPDLVLVSAHVTAYARGRLYEEDLVQRFVLENGQAVECRTFVEDTRAWDAFVGPATIELPREEHVGSR